MAKVPSVVNRVEVLAGRLTQLLREVWSLESVGYFTSSALQVVNFTLLVVLY